MPDDKMPPTKDDDRPQKDKAAAAGITLGIGMLSVIGKLYTVAKAEEKGGKMTCPTCAGLPKGGPTQGMSQRYVCNDDVAHGPFEFADCARGMEVDGKFVVIDQDEIAAAKKSILPEKELSLQVHKREDVQAYTAPKGNTYVFLPEGAGASGANSLYGALIDLLKARPDLVLLAKTNMRNADHLVEVTVGLDDQLIVQEMIWPEDMKAFPAVVREKPSAKNMAIGEALLDASVEPFDPTEYAKDSRARVNAVIEEAAGSKPKKKAPSKTAQKKAANDNLGDLLAQALAARKAS